jgi:hypothetical protein
MSYKDDDIAFGKKHEDLVMPKLSVFGEVVKMEDQFSPFDFRTKNKSTFIELKTRTNHKDKYPTTMVSQSKVEIAKQYPKKKFIFCFNFTDGLYYITYNKELFDTFEISRGSRITKGVHESNIYCYIPVCMLQKVAC